MSDQQGGGPSRRGFLRTAALAGAGASPLGLALGGGAAPASAAATTSAGRWKPDPDSRQFTVAVMPDTQFLYWGSQHSVNPAPQEASFRYVIDHSGAGDNIVFLAHLGDLTEDADPTSFAAVGKAFELLD